MKKHRRAGGIFLAGIFMCGIVWYGIAGSQQAAAAVPWYSQSWTYRHQVTVNHLKVSGTTDLSNFPVLVSTTLSDLKHTSSGGHVSKTDGSDIVFTSSDGTTLLPFEIESYSPTTGTVTAWVNIPSLSPLTDVSVYMYYGNAAATSQQNPVGVWDANYRNILHLKEDPSLAGSGGIKDSSTAAAHATDNGSMLGSNLISGKIGNALNFDGIDDFLSSGVPSSYNGSSGTVTLWIKPTFNGNDGLKYIIFDHNGGYPLWIAKNADNNIWFLFNNGPGQVIGGTVPAGSMVANTWNHVAVRWSRTAKLDNNHYVEVLLNGSNAGAGFNDATGANNMSASFLYWGKQGASTGNGEIGQARPWSGAYDEIHVSNIARSRDWIVTEYNNQNSPATFITIAAEEVSSGTTDMIAPVVSITSPGAETTVSGNISISANASDDVGVVGVQFGIDGTNAGSEDMNSPYSLTWNTTAVSDGTHTLTAIARDTVGNTSTSTIQVSVDNTDRTAPSVSITNPANGAAVTGQVTFTAVAADNFGVAGVQFSIDGTNLGSEDTDSPYTTTENVSSRAEGTHSLRAVARDLAGNTASSTISFTVYNDTAAPVISSPSATPSGTSVVIDWTTDEAADGRIDYGTSISYGSSVGTTSLTTTHSFTIGGLTPNTPYHYKLTSSDAAANIGTTNDLTFTTGSGIPWYSASWKYRKAAVVPAARVTGNTALSNFPVLVSVTSPDLKAVSSGGHVSLNTGADIVFTASDGITKIPHEIESYSPTTGTLVAWVKPASISPISDTNVYMYYGNAAATTPSVSGTWNNEYEGIYHLVEDPATAGTGGIRDSSVEAANATDNGSMTTADRVAAKIGMGFRLDGTNDYLSSTIPASFNGSVGYISFWFKPTFNGNDGLKYMILDHNGNYPMWIAKNSNNNIWFFFNNGPGRVLSAQVPAGSITANSWNHLSVRWNISTRLENGRHVDLRLNGSNAGGTFNDNPGNKTLPRSSLYWGRQGSSVGNGEIGTARYWSGVLDELRISNAVRTPEWVAAEYANQNNPSVFVSFGTEETAGQTGQPPPDTQAPVVSVSSPTQGSTVSGTVSVGALASDNVEVVGVQFKIDGGNFGSEDLTIPYGVSWNTIGIPDGSHTISAVARDAAGNSTVSGTITVNVSNNTTPPATVTIMPLGDSITSGTTAHDSYRRPLWQRLQIAGKNVDFVGDFTNNTGGPAPHQDFDLNHQSVSGIRADQWLPFTEEANRHDAQRVLLYLGNNDAYNNQSTQSTLNEIGQLIDALRGANPSVRIYVGNLYLWGDTSMRSKLADFNNNLPAFVASKTTSQSPVIMVNHTNISDATDTYDGLHLNDTGDQKMADNWYNAIIGSL